MLDAVKKSVIYDQYAIKHNYPIEKLMERAGKGIAKVLLQKYGRGKRIGFFCGGGNNGGDGMVAARYLEKTCKPEVYLISEARKLRSPETQMNWKKYKGLKKDNVSLQDIPDHFDIVVDCLLGTGVAGKLREPYASIVKRLNQLKGKKVAIDQPTKGFKADLVISMMFKKTPNAVVVDIGYPKSLAKKVEKYLNETKKEKNS